QVGTPARALNHEMVLEVGVQGGPRCVVAHAELEVRADRQPGRELTEIELPTDHELIGARAQSEPRSPPRDHGPRAGAVRMMRGGLVSLLVGGGQRDAWKKRRDRARNDESLQHGRSLLGRARANVPRRAPSKAAVSGAEL